MQFSPYISPISLIFEG